MSTKAQFLGILNQGGSDVIYHRSDDTTLCPCRTYEGYRDPIWHLQHPSADMCNEAGFLPGTNDVTISVRAIFMPIQSTRATRLRTQYILSDFGEIETGDYLGIFADSYQGKSLNFYDWSQAGDDWIEHDSRRFMVVHANAIPDPDGGQFHHWEVGLRLISNEDL